MLRRLAIVILVFMTLLMGALGWILGRPGVLRPESHVFAAPVKAQAAPSSGTVIRGSAEAPPVPPAHGDARGE
jgi:hypothetical protein